MPTVDEVLAQAQQAKQAGDLDGSVAICRHILAQAPDCGHAWHLLASIAYARGQLPDAVDCHLKAAQFLPTAPAAHYDLGHALHVSGRLAEAAAAYRRALELAPTNFAACANLGAVLQQQGHLDEAAAYYRRALQQKADSAEVHTNLGMVLKEQGQLEEALAEHRLAIQLNPNLPVVHNNLATTFQALGRFDEAVAAYLHSLSLQPRYETYFNLGTAYRKLARLDDAIRSYQAALKLQPNQAEAYNNLGVAYKDQGKLTEALAAYEQALAIRPDYAEVHNNKGAVYQERGDLESAIACYRRALDIKPQFAEALSNLGVTLHDQDQLDQAKASLQQLLTINPEFADAHTYLGNVLKDQARPDEAVVSFRRALAKNSDLVIAHSNLLYTLQFCPGYDAAAIYAEHQRWDERYAAQLEKNHPVYTNDRSPNRRLKVGYVSPDFRNHCQAFFTIPLFSHHNHEHFEIVCYADVLAPDKITSQLQSCTDHWRDISGLNAAQAADLVHSDQIDVLVDLTMHMKRNHLLVFAHKPAPVQICWLAYPGTTGLKAIDYRLTDPYLDPPGLFDRFYSEESIRLPDTFWCYDPLTTEPAVNDLPALKNQRITFGSLNNFCKLNDGTLALWSRVMQAVDGSRLILFVSEGSHRDRTRDFLIGQGISADRLTFVSRQPRRRYLEQYHHIDIGLDTLPYNGHTTSLDAFWMGVPVVTLVGQTVVGRAGYSQLTNLGLPDLIATTPAQYVEIISRLAADLPRLSHLRSTLRSRMEQSPLMNAPLFAKNIESAYRALFHRWCAAS